MQLRHLLLLPLLVLSLKAASVDDLTFTLNGDSVSYIVTDCSEADGVLTAVFSQNSTDSDGDARSDRLRHGSR